METKKEKQKKWREVNKKNKKKYDKKYNKKNKKKIREYHKKWYKNNKNRIKEQHKEYYQNNKDKLKEYRKEYVKKNREKIKKDNKNWQKKNKDKVRKIQKEWQENNKEKFKKIQRKYQKRKRETDVRFRIDKNISECVRLSLKGKKAGRKEDLIKHLESRFENWMSWDNYGKWHIDHIKPKNLFKYTTAEDPEFKKCWSLDNLQPLGAIENIRKSNKY